MQRFKLFERVTARIARLLVITVLAVVGTTEMWGGSVSLTYNFDSNYDAMWSGDVSSQNSYWQVSGAATFTIPITEQPTSDITITVRIGYYSNGTEHLEKVSATGTESSSTWVLSETSPESHTGSGSSNDVNRTFTVTKTNTPSTLASLAITFDRKTGKYLRVLKVAISYTSAATNSIIVKQNDVAINALNFGTVSTDNGYTTINISGTCNDDAGTGIYYTASLSGEDKDYFDVSASGYIYSSSGNLTISYEDLTEAREYAATLTIGSYKASACQSHDYDWFDVDIPITITYDPPCSSPSAAFGTDDVTLNWVDGPNPYTNSTFSRNGSGTISYELTDVDPAGCATVNGSTGAVTFSAYGIVEVTANVAADNVNSYCAGSASYILTMGCKSRTLSFAAGSDEIDFGTAYTRTASPSAGSGDITYSIETSVMDNVTIDPSTGALTITGEDMITVKAEIEADGGYCGASATYDLTINAVVPTVSGFTEEHTSSSMTLNGSQVTSKGGASEVTAYGYIYSSVANTVGTLILGGANVTAAQVAAADIALNTAFSEKAISPLSSGTTYYVRAYATNSAGTGYSDIQTVRTVAYTDYQFSCAELTLTKPDAGDLVFITSSAGKTVRSQERFHIEGTGLTPGATVTFSFGNAALNALFEFKKADGTAPTVSAAEDATKGTINEDIYVFYTPTGTSDGLDQATNLTATVEGAKPKITTLNTKTIIGRHLPTDFVIAAKDGNKWYALPADMAGTGNPTPVEIAVDDINNPTIAYTAASNIYNLYENGTKQYVQLGMRDNVNGSDKSYALWANNSSGSNDIGKNGGLAESSLGGNFQWLLTQTVAAAANAQSTAYTISNPNNANALKAWFAAGGGPKWGLYAYGTSELRLIPASDVTFTEAYFVEWAQHGGVVEVDAQGVAATSVVAHLNGATSAAIDLVQTKAGDTKNKTSKYNYTVNFGDGIDFAAAASNGAMLTLEWKNGETVKAMSNIMVPKIVATSATMSSINSGDKPWDQWEVHVLPGVTLTANAGDFASNDVTIKHLEIYQGATVEVTKGAAGSGILTATTLVLRNGWSRAGAKTYDVARLFVTASTATLKATNVYADWYIDYDQYYPVAVPWNATVANFTYRYCSVEPSVGYNQNIRLRYYDGNSRATNVQEGVGSGANWKEYGAAGNIAVPETLTPSSGYIMTAKRPSGKAFSIIRMPLTLPSGEWSDGAWTTNGESGNISTTHKDQIAVTAYGVSEGSKTAYAEGWNLIANPYMSIYTGALSLTPIEGDATTVKVVNIPDVDFKEYSQVATATAKLKPASAFLIQAPATGTVTFGTANRKPSAPSYRREAKEEPMPEQQAYIVLNGEKAEDMMGLFISDKYTADYDLNGDVEKLLSGSNSLRTYMLYGDMNMAYVAINEVLAKEWIPVTVRIPADGEYTFSLHEASKVDELECIYLKDYLTDEVTNLIEENYTFNAEVGTISGRFSINAIKGVRPVPTGIDIVGGTDSKEPIKFLYHDKVFILHNGVIYDATGKKVREINK